MTRQPRSSGSLTSGTVIGALFASSNATPRRTPTARALAAIGLPAPASVPRMLSKPSSLTSLPLDAQTAFVASQIDGSTTIQEILDLGTIPRAAVFESLCRLVKLGVVTFG